VIPGAWVRTSQALADGKYQSAIMHARGMHINDQIAQFGDFSTY
jgi:hypothetical protein